MKSVRGWGRLGMKYNWKIKNFADIAQFNPKESIAKGTIAKKVPMDKLQSFCRDISGYILEEYKGGTKFKNGDTIMARITPCLENGKTAKVNFLDDEEIGFGSTEYIIFRSIDGVSDEDYLYYLICSPFVRNMAIKSMVGSSGRQRVQIDVIKSLQIEVPPLNEQQKIGSLLKSIDDKIAINNAINDNLEQQVSSIYQSWFENFTLSNGVCPESWQYGTLSDIADVSSGKRPPMKSLIQTNAVNIPLVGATSIMGFTNKVNHIDKILVTGRVGTHGIIQRFNSPCWTSDNTLVITSKYYEFTNQILQRIDYSSINRGSTQPLITQGDMNKVTVLIPDDNILTEFEAIASTLMFQYEVNITENKKLAKVRDTLLPKLMSGELDVSGADL